MKKAIIAIVIIVVMTLNIGCLTSKPASTGPSLTSLATRMDTNEKDDVTQQKAIDDNKAKLDGKANTGAVSDLQTQVTALKNNASTTDLSNYYTKAEMNTRIAEAVAALKADQTWITNNPSNPAPTTGTVTFITNPASLQILGNGQLCYTMKIVNGAGQWQYVKPIITMTTSTSTTVGTTATTGLPIISITYSATSINHANMTQSPPMTSTNAAVLPLAPTASLVFIPISGGNTNLGEFQIAAGATAEILVCIQLPVTGTPVLWNITNSISHRGI